MKTNDNSRKDNGITIVALVITIIVLIILAGVSIRLVLGDNGIINKTRYSDKVTLNAQVEEQEQLNEAASYLENMGQTNSPDEGTRVDWSIVKNEDGTGTISHFEGKIPEDGILVIPNVVDEVKITKLEISADDAQRLCGYNYGGSMPILYNDQDIEATGFYNASIKKVIISEGIQIIGKSAFWGNKALEEVVLPNSITQIEDIAFSNCPNLKSITIPGSVTSIGSQAFSSCIGLTSITIPNNVTTIKSNAFFGCSGLTSITLPNRLSTIEYALFSYCTALTSIKIPENTTRIENSAFSGCRSLTNITIPSNVLAIGNYAFDGCTNLENVYFKHIAAPTIQGNKAFYKSSGVKTKFYFENVNVKNAFIKVAPYNSKYAEFYIEGEELTSSSSSSSSSSSNW